MANTFDLERVNHSDAYSFLDGVHVNGAESYFARLRRMIRGQHHRVLLAGSADTPLMPRGPKTIAGKATVPS